MAVDLAGFKVRIGNVLQDVSSFIATSAGAEMEQGIRNALEQFGRDVPREVIADITGDGATYDLTLPDTYLDGYSGITTIEYPAGERFPTILDSTAWSLYRTESTLRLRLLAATPTLGSTVRITFTGMHTIDDLDSATVTTIPAYSTEAFTLLATAQCLYILASRFLHEQEDTLNLDTVDRGSRTDQARRLANDLMKQYRELIGESSEGALRPASGMVDWDSSYAGSGYRRLTHSRRYT